MSGLTRQPSTHGVSDADKLNKKQSGEPSCAASSLSALDIHNQAAEPLHARMQTRMKKK